MYNLRALEEPGRSAATHLVVPVRNRDEWRDDEMGVSFV